MKRDVALRLDGMLIGIRAGLDGIAAYAQRHLSKSEFQFVARQIGASMFETIEISQALYRAHPDILPEELIPESRIARRMERQRKSAVKRRSKRKSA